MRESGQRNMAPATQDLLQRIMTERELEHILSALCHMTGNVAFDLPDDAPREPQRCFQALLSQFLGKNLAPIV
ncbi:hypothetical protein SAMN05216412_10691 [Nitrosospira multiformis]|uniref:Uncharacterized protein n=2 Tax=Nitrosospira multiformis TaxID=1231 RepID=A0A1I0EB89_9PROT|nr:hypothetical protein SAMN05216412_10691 [Nitrosospira multiformis]